VLSIAAARRPLERLEPASGILLFAVALLVGHVLPALVAEISFHSSGHFVRVDGIRVSDLLLLLAPVAPLAAAVLLLRALEASRKIWLLAAASGYAYALGAGIHAAGASLGHLYLGLAGQSLAHVWEEQLGHVLQHGGWLGLLAAFALADRGSPVGQYDRRSWIAAILLGAGLMLGPLEGGTWWLVVAAAPAFAVLALRHRSQTAVTVAAAFAVAVVGLACWALANRGMPQPSELNSQSAAASSLGEPASAGAISSRSSARRAVSARRS
jgi:hypothetical protein